MIGAGDVLRRTAHAYRTGQVRWGRLFFHNPDNGCRCVAGGVTHVIDPDNAASDPREIPGRHLALRALTALADYLIDNGLARPAFTDGMFDPVETVADWNDAPSRTVDDVLFALEGAAPVADRILA